ncbi:MAG: hypothetical protein KDD33_13935, partial [Bdellovibrionales bacterium]|nr:hypothetical protein [Bdellovibrionales bacterium]
MKSTLFIIVSLFLIGPAFADDSVFLDPPYSPALKKATRLKKIETVNAGTFKALESVAVDHLQTALLQTPVKSQGRRGTCSIFSSTAVLEYLLKKEGITSGDWDLSEQWLEYITAGQRGSEGSWSYYNFDRYGDYGYLFEEDWSYNPLSWHPYDESYWQFSATELEKQLFAQACAPLQGTFRFEGCLIGQQNPDYLDMEADQLLQVEPNFFELRSKAKNHLQSELGNLKIHSESVWSNTDVLDHLDRGEVVALDVTFFYEAWNHGKALELGLSRDVDMLNQGVVSYPHPSSMDYKKSREPEVAAGHSIVLVGYDLDKEIEREVLDHN